MDFTLKKYTSFLSVCHKSDFEIITFSQYLDGLNLKTPAPDSYTDPPRKNQNIIILRHDVDRRPEYALKMAELEHSYGVKGTYYFRMTKKCFIPIIIQSIAAMGHEIGYHYEDLNLVSSALSSGFKQKMSFESEEFVKQLAYLAIQSFETNLNRLRNIASIKTICMHGSPLSKWDNRLIWKYYNYRDFSIYGEPYFDIDFSKVLYLTDTGRSWRADMYSVRDKLALKQDIKETDHYNNWAVKPLENSAMRIGASARLFQQQFTFRTTSSVIESLHQNFIPRFIMMTFHPQRWMNNLLLWAIELISQNIKNQLKFILIRLRMC